MKPEDFDQSNGTLDGGVTIHVCPAGAIHNPATWPGVYSAADGSNYLWWLDGELVDPEIENATALELEAISWRELPEADPAWGRHGDYRDGRNA